MKKDQFKGRIKAAQGKVEEVAGRVMGNAKMEEKGKVTGAKGKVQADHGDRVAAAAKVSD